MKNKILYLSFLAILLNINNIFSQNLSLTGNHQVHPFNGRIVDTENHPVIFAHVVNIRRNIATITDSIGFFKIMVVNNDSLRITAIGYFTKFIVVDDLASQDTLLHIIKMEKRTYDLPTVNIYELRWQVFKSEFMEQKVEDDKTAERISNWMANLVPSDELRMIFQAARGPGFTINYKSKAEKARRKVAILEKKYSIIAPKFNDKIIMNLTGLQGKEIYKFLQYCNFSEDYLIQSTEYEIIESILKKWNEYKVRLLKK